PATLLWDPPVIDEPFSEDEALRHRKAMTRAWLDSLAPALGLEGADALLSDERAREAITIRAEPGSLPEEEDWPTSEEGEDTGLLADEPLRDTVVTQAAFNAERVM